MQEFMETRIKPYVQDSTYCSYIEGLNSNFYNNKIAGVRINELTLNLLESYCLDLLSEKSRQTAHIIVTLTNLLSLYLFSKELIPENYALKMKR